MSAKNRILSTAIVVASVLSLFLAAGQIQAAPLGAPASQAWHKHFARGGYPRFRTDAGLGDDASFPAYTHRVRYHWIPVVARIVALLCNV